VVRDDVRISLLASVQGLFLRRAHETWLWQVVLEATLENRLRGGLTSSRFGGFCNGRPPVRTINLGLQFRCTSLELELGIACGEFFNLGGVVLHPGQSCIQLFNRCKQFLRLFFEFFFFSSLKAYLYRMWCPDSEFCD
jgi:hypothetical protein